MTDHVHECKWKLRFAHRENWVVAECENCTANLVDEEIEARLNATERLSAEALAKKFHEYYEELAPSFDYETREETRSFSPHSRNGKLMIAVSKKIIADILEGKDD